MENISLKQWIIAGAFSGVVVGTLVFFTVTLRYLFEGYRIFSTYFHTFFNSFLYYVFSGIIIGIILYFIRDKLKQRKLLKCLLVSIGIIFGLFVILLVVFPHRIFFIDSIPFSLVNLTPYFVYGAIAGIIYLLFSSLFVFPTFELFFMIFAPFILAFLISIAFGFLINYFVNRIEKKY